MLEDVMPATRGQTSGRKFSEMVGIHSYILGRLYEQTVHTVGQHPRTPAHAEIAVRPTKPLLITVSRESVQLVRL
jgi:hypothetical protein